MDILSEVSSLFDQMVMDRRFLHENPELSGEEVNTLRFIANRLKTLDIPYYLIEDGGLVGVINEGKPGKTVLLRADIDALPINESEQNRLKQKVCVSRCEGVMHACGHDAHTAMMLCTAQVLSRHRDLLSGQVLLVFEQGEETGAYIKNLIPFIQERFTVDACYATHVRWDIDSGKVALMPGAVFSGAFGFDITLRGEGGHGARPDLCQNPIDCFASICAQINALRMRVVEPDQVLTCSFGLVQSGEKANVIPGSLRFAGTVRTFDVLGAGELFASEMKNVIEHCAMIHHCKVEYTRFTKPLFETYNNPTLTALARDAAAQVLGGDALINVKPWMASESMNVFCKLYPGVISFTGIMSEDVGSGANHHTPEFDIDERGMVAGAATAVAYAQAFLSQDIAVEFTPYAGSTEELLSRSI